MELTKKDLKNFLTSKDLIKPEVKITYEIADF